jgi:hypothetical protein
MSLIDEAKQTQKLVRSEVTEVERVEDAYSIRLTSGSGCKEAIEHDRRLGIKLISGIFRVYDGLTDVEVFVELENRPGTLNHLSVS